MPSFTEEPIDYSNECEEVIASSFNDLLNDNVFDLNSFGILHLNIRSINSNFDSFLAYFQAIKYKFPIIVLTETWLSSNNSDSYHIPGYSTYSQNSNGRSGGIRVFVHSGYSVQTLNIQHGDSFQSLNLKITIPNFKCLTVCAIYKPPCTLKHVFNSELDEAYCNAFRPNENLIFIGDFNMNLFLSDELQISNFLNFMQSLGLIPLITLPTRNPPDSESCSLIDHIWTNFPPPIKSFVFDTAITDHFPVAAIFQFLVDAENIEIRFRDFSVANVDKFLNDREGLVEGFNQNSVDLNVQATHVELLQWLENILDNYFPKRLKRIGRKRAASPWVTDAILNCINKKHRLFKLLKRGIIDRTYFNFYKNKLRYLISFAKRLYYNNCFMLARNNMKKTWAIINKCLNRSKHSKVDTLMANDVLLTAPLEICGHFDSVFVNIVNNLESSLPSNLDNSDSFLDLIPYNPDSAVFLHSDPSEIERGIKNLRNNKNLSMPTKFLKLFSPILSPLLSRLFNSCIDNGDYPNILKTACVTPVFKVGDPKDPCNYRPISVLTDINKVYEELLLCRLNSFLDSKNILSTTQYGFRSNRSTQEACIDLLTVLLSAYNKKSFALCLFIDLKKAFDTINHSRLLKKMERYGIRGDILQLFQSYLTDRRQCVRMGEVKSNLLPISTGVPQGSKLGPLLFNLYVNDMALLPSIYSTFQFADDTAFAAVNDDVFQLIQQFNANLNIFHTWCVANKLFLNLEKTKAMVLTPKRTDFEFPNIVINNTIVEYVQEYKYLGIIIDSKLSFAKHIKNLNGRLNRVAGTSFSMKNILSLEAAKTFYFSMAYSLISYVIVVWGGSSLTLVDDLQVAQNKIVRNLFADKVEHHHTSDLYKALGLLNVSQIYKLELGKLMFNALFNNKFSGLKQNLLELNWSHNYNTRRIDVYRLPFCRVRVNSNAPIFKAVHFWNGLPLNVRNRPSLATFTHCLKQHLLNS